MKKMCSSSRKCDFITNTATDYRQITKITTLILLKIHLRITRLFGALLSHFWRIFQHSLIVFLLIKDRNIFFQTELKVT